MKPMLEALPYREVWAVDFEFMAPAGERQIPVCLVARELRSGRTIRLWQDQFGPTPPFPISADVLFVAYYASAELGCFRALGWPMPARILDLFTEFRDATNGLPTPAGAGLLGALTYFGLDAIGATEKTEMRDLVLRGGPWSSAERGSDSRLLRKRRRRAGATAAGHGVPHRSCRARWCGAATWRRPRAWNTPGIPIDVPTLALLREHWTDIQDQLIAAIDADYQVFDGRTFKHERFEAWLARTGIPWPLLESGQLDLSDDTFRRAAKSYPAVSPLRELRSALADLRLNALAVGRDGRNRTILSAFRSRTGRNQPSNSKSIFGTSVWLRGLIQPPPGHGVAYIDWSQQEFGIAAALSGDFAMQAAYLSGDPYLAFAKQAGAIPPDGTKKTHGDIRELFKQCVLAVQYGMEVPALALRIAQPPIVAQGLLQAHRETYRKFWLWSDAAVDQAMLFGSLHTVLGWHVHVDDNPNPRSLRNFPMQANGAEMLRLACCLATECGIEVCAPVHDAVLICAPLDSLERDIAHMRAIMAEASRVILGRI